VRRQDVAVEVLRFAQDDEFLEWVARWLVGPEKKSFSAEEEERRGPREEKAGAENLLRLIVRAHPSKKARRIGHPQVHRVGGDRRVWQ
jgi:hypothetical protein